MSPRADDPHEWLTASGASGPLIQRLCDFAKMEIPADGASIALHGRGNLDGPIAASDDWSRTLVQAEFTLGHGPSFDVTSTGQPVEIPDTRHLDAERWPGYGEVLHDAHVGSLYCFPLHLGAANLGTLHVFRVLPSRLSEQSFNNCLAVSDLATSTLLYMQAGLADSQFEDLVASADADRLRIHQASGMVAAMLNCSITDAMARLRARAFADGISLYQLSMRIIDREVHLEP